MLAFVHGGSVVPRLSWPKSERVYYFSQLEREVTQCLPLYFSITVGVRYYISSRRTTQSLDIYIS